MYRSSNAMMLCVLVIIALLLCHVQIHRAFIIPSTTTQNNHHHQYRNHHHHQQQQHINKQRNAVITGFNTYTYTHKYNHRGQITSLNLWNALTSTMNQQQQKQPVVVDNTGWKFIDDIYIITTTQQDNQRLEKTLTELDKVGIIRERISIRTYAPDDEDRVRGCYNSHISILKEVYKKYNSSKKDYKVLIFEDNIEVTLRANIQALDDINTFMTSTSSSSDNSWDVFHLAYMMYVPGLSLQKMQKYSSIVRMFSTLGTSVGTSSYLISKAGVAKILQYDKENKGYKEAIPNVMAELFPQSRYAIYPMLFHRGGKIKSIVNPQLDSFRKVMFTPLIYTSWESLMVSTQMQTNQLFPTVLITLLMSLLSVIYISVANATSASSGFLNIIYAVSIIPLAVGIWGQTLFNSGKGFATPGGGER